MEYRKEIDAARTRRQRKQTAAQCGLRTLRAAKKPAITVYAAILRDGTIKGATTGPLRPAEVGSC